MIRCPKCPFVCGFIIDPSTTILPASVIISKHNYGTRFTVHFEQVECELCVWIRGTGVFFLDVACNVRRRCQELPFS
jgi:hypothetical protein